MACQAEKLEIDMEHSSILGTSLEVSRVALGTWAIGGWMWGGTDETESIATIRAAVDQGINERFRRVAPLHVLQPPYNLFERGIEADLLPYCQKNRSRPSAIALSAAV